MKLEFQIHGVHSPKDSLKSWILWTQLDLVSSIVLLLHVLLGGIQAGLHNYDGQNFARRHQHPLSTFNGGDGHLGGGLVQGVQWGHQGRAYKLH